MGALDLIDKYYPQDNELRNILLVHSRSVADKALWIADKHPELNLDITFLNEAAMLHDLGIFLTHAPGIKCLGKEPYICWCAKKVFRGMLWFVSVIPVRDFHWKRLLNSSFLFRIVKCCRSV